MSRTLSMNVSCGKMRFTSPMSSASFAVARRADINRSMALDGPTSRGSSQAMPCSAISPRWAKAVVKIIRSEAKRMSAHSTMKPSPAVAPLSAAITGLPMRMKYNSGACPRTARRGPARVPM